MEAESTKGGGKPNAALDSRLDGKALSEMLALKPERAKPAFRNFREGDRNGGIIRSPLFGSACISRWRRSGDGCGAWYKATSTIMLYPGISPA